MGPFQFDDSPISRMQEQAIQQMQLEQQQAAAQLRQQQATMQAGAQAANTATNYAPGAAQNFSANPVQSSGWTGVSSAADPYGIHNVGFNLDNAATGMDPVTGKPLTGGNVGRDVLLGTSGFGQNVGPGGTPLFTGYSKYENPHADSGSAPGSSGGASAAAAANAGSSYPAMDNAYGLGGAMPQATPQAPAASAYSGQSGVSVNVPDTSSRGFNPWSMVGESNARDNDKGVVQPQSPVL